MDENKVPRGRFVAWIVGTWLGAHLALIAGHVLTVFVYSVAIAPGLDASEYAAFAERSGPWFSILAGGPVFWVLGRVLRSKLAPRGRSAGLWVWALYSACDLAIVLALASFTPLLTAQWVASQSIKLVAVWLGTREAAGQPG